MHSRRESRVVKKAETYLVGLEVLNRLPADEAINELMIATSRMLCTVRDYGQDCASCPLFDECPRAPAFVRGEARYWWLRDRMEERGIVDRIVRRYWYGEAEDGPAGPMRVIG